MKIFTCGQIKEIDRFTIENEPVRSADLMERAAGRLFEWITARFSRDHKFCFFTGPGNNGGDGLVLARLLWYSGYKVEVHHINIPGNVTEDWKLNHARIIETGEIPFFQIDKSGQFPVPGDNTIVIDAIFGSGLSRPVDGIAAEAVRHINSLDCTVISIDMPSGLFGEDNSNNRHENIVQADHTLSFQFPRISFMFAENLCYTGNWHILPIGLHPAAIAGTPSSFHYTVKDDVSPLLKVRSKFDHKGIFGHGLLAAGSYEKSGAAVLAARATLRTGAGLLTCHVPESIRTVIQSSVPEAMLQTDINDKLITDIRVPEIIDAAAAGPGIDTNDETCIAVKKLLLSFKKPIVLDADALNILGIHREWLALIPAGSILTPHPREFERISGCKSKGYQRLMDQITFSAKYNCIIVLKGAHTSISLPDGNVFFNSTGNPGMATAGSGDVLTGIILSLLAQGYEPGIAAITGVYIHGLAGDIAAEKLPYESIIASDIIDNIGNAFHYIRH